MNKWLKWVERAVVALESIAADLHALRDAGYIMDRSVSAQSRTARAMDQLASSRDAYEGGHVR